MKKFNFDLTIASNALLCPNPESFYAKAYLQSEDIAKNFKVIPGVKSSTKVATTTFSRVLVAETCDFSSTASALSAITMSVCPVQAQVQICKKDIESSFVSMEMAKGSSNWDVASYMNHYWEQLGAEIGEEIEQIRWRGNTGNGAYTGTSAYLALCTGYEALLAADSTVNDVTLTAVTVANVIAALEAVLASAAANCPQILSNKKDLRFYVASNVYSAFQIAASKGNTISYVTELLNANFGGITLVECPGMTSSKIVLTRTQNLVYLLDGESDSTDLKAIDLSETTGQPLLRTAVWMKIGFGLLNGNEIVYFA